MSTYVFDNKDILNSSIRLGPSVVFSTSTTMSIIHRDVTNVSNGYREHVGSVRWKGRALELGGVAKSTDLIKEKPHAILDVYVLFDMQDNISLTGLVTGSVYGNGILQVLNIRSCTRAGGGRSVSQSSKRTEC